MVSYRHSHTRTCFRSYVFGGLGSHASVECSSSSSVGNRAETRLLGNYGADIAMQYFVLLSGAYKLEQEVNLERAAYRPLAKLRRDTSKYNINFFQKRY